MKEHKIFTDLALALNEAFPLVSTRRKFKVGRVRITYEHRSPKNLWGRFGGGWQIEAGFRYSGGTLIVLLFVASLRFDWND